MIFSNFFVMIEKKVNVKARHLRRDRMEHQLRSQGLSSNRPLRRVRGLLDERPWERGWWNIRDTNGKLRFAVSGLKLAVFPYLGLKIRGLISSLVNYIWKISTKTRLPEGKMLLNVCWILLINGSRTINHRSSLNQARLQSSAGRYAAGW